MKWTALSSAVQRFTAERTLKRGRSIHDLLDRWDEIVGEPISTIARPVSLIDGTLLLAVENSPAAQEASFSQTVYAERVNRYLGGNAVREVRIENRGKRAPAPKRRRYARRLPAPKPDLESVELTAEERAAIQQDASSIQSRQLRAAYERAALARLKREKWEAQRRPQP